MIGNQLVIQRFEEGRNLVKVLGAHNLTGPTQAVYQRFPELVRHRKLVGLHPADDNVVEAAGTG